jgi:outer membrane protein assembly factor BamB
LLLSIGGADWPGWRGPTGQGHSTEKDLPLKWDKTENVRWKVGLPDAGNSTPVVWGDRVFLTQASDKRLWPPQKPPNFPAGTSYGGYAILAKRSLMCFHRADGKLLWQRDTIYDKEESTHGTNPFCSASPVTDGERVIVSHGSAGLVCYDFDGKELWKKDLGKLEHVWGNASSPILWGELCILWCGPGERQFLLAVNKKTGETVWEHHEQGGDSGREGKKFTGSWSTPIIGRVGEQDQLILSVPRKLKGFDPKTGKELWAAGLGGELIYHSPLYADGIAITGGTAIKIDGTGDLTRNRLWQRPGASVGSGVIAGEYFYVHGDGGAPRCVELKTGKELWDTQIEKRPGTTAWGSLVHAAGRLYITDQSGTTLVYAAGPKYELLAANRLGEHVNASVAVSNGELFIRTWKHLWCIGGSKEKQ